MQCLRRAARTTPRACMTLQATTTQVSLKQRQRKNPSQAAGFYHRPLSTDSENAKLNGIDKQLMETELQRWMKRAEPVSIYEIGCGTGLFFSEMVIRRLDYLLSEGFQSTSETIVDDFIGVDRRTTEVEEATKRLITRVETSERMKDSSASHVKQVLSQLLQHVILMPFDATREWGPNAPYDVIKVNFRLSHTDESLLKHLSSQLKPEGVIYVPIGSESSQALYRFQKEDLMMNEAVMKTAKLFELEAGERKNGYESGIELDEDEESKQKEKLRERRRQEVKRELEIWKAGFEEVHGRKPTRDDLLSDQAARGLFLRFSELTKLS